ncbi:hypothetical protein [Chryseobacterium sp.]|uniref:hypothetical protein n=1 Tax=Chryseobacterium sp. TaxID=1871047 RepID=UPI003FA5D05D
MLKAKRYEQDIQFTFLYEKTKIISVVECLIYLRITIDGKISEISTKRTVKPSIRNVIFQKKNKSI